MSLQYTNPSNRKTSFINTLGEDVVLATGSAVKIRYPRSDKVIEGRVFSITRVGHSPVYNDSVIKGFSKSGRKAPCEAGYVEPYDVVTVRSAVGNYNCVVNSDVGPESEELDNCLIVQDGADVISCAAQKVFVVGKEWIIPSPAHHDDVTRVLTTAIHELRYPGSELEIRDNGQGFLTRKGEYVDRHVAWRIALAARQIRHLVGGCLSKGGTLYSECLL